jgi:hypothetical protein
MKRLTAWSILLIGLATGCATEPPRPRVHSYPARGQHPAQTSGDAAYCDLWAKQQTGYDPVGGVAGGVAGGTYKYPKSREGYERAYAACMSGRYWTASPAPPGIAPTTPVVATPAPVVPTPRHVHVPPGHYPPPGYCRIWHPGRPPGHQPRAFPCHQPIAVPQGSFILYDGFAWDGDYDWRAQARRQPGSVPSVIVELSVKR